ncbi:MAG: SufS family cysteine desulfurase [bacterium]
MEDLLQRRVAVPEVSCPIEVFDVEMVRDDFPLLHKRVHGKRLVYLDNAATSQKPRVVIEAVKAYYEVQNANIHRGVHYLSELATSQYEEARVKVRKFINAGSEKEIIFTRGTTESVNLVAASYGRQHLKDGDEIVISTMEHHSNIVPWQLLCEQTGAKLRVIPMNDSGELVLAKYESLLTERTKLVALVHISNSLGTINPVKEMIASAHARNIPVLLDGAQAVVHTRVDVQDLDCDFYAFSGHKMLGPTGIGVLYGKEALLDAMPPYQGGGDMIKSVTFDRTTYNDLPYKFEAGTPNMAGTIGLGHAIDYLLDLGFDKIAGHEASLLQYAHEALSCISQVKLIGTAKRKAGVVSFVIEGVHAHDVGTILDQNGIAIRTGHHCTQPVMDWFDVPATSRASFVFYNTREEIDLLVKGIYGVINLFK